MEFDDVEDFLERFDGGDFDNEEAALYDEIQYYSDVARELSRAGREDDAEYFEELAVERYQSMSYVMQLDQGDDVEF